MLLCVVLSTAVWLGWRRYGDVISAVRGGDFKISTKCAARLVSWCSLPQVGKEEVALRFYTICSSSLAYART